MFGLLHNTTPPMALWPSPFPLSLRHCGFLPGLLCQWWQALGMSCPAIEGSIRRAESNQPWALPASPTTGYLTSLVSPPFTGMAICHHPQNPESCVGLKFVILSLQKKKKSENAPTPPCLSGDCLMDPSSHLLFHST